MDYLDERKSESVNLVGVIGMSVCDVTSAA